MAQHKHEKFNNHKQIDTTKESETLLNYVTHYITLFHLA